MNIPHEIIVNTYSAKSLQSCPTLCDPIDGSPPGSPVPGIFQVRVPEWGAIAYLKICYDFNNALRVLGKRDTEIDEL